MQTPAQILRCLALGRYTARVEGDELRIRGPQPLAGPLPDSIRARREGLIAYLLDHCGNVWPAAPGSEIYVSLAPKKSPVTNWPLRGRQSASREERARELQRILRERRNQREGVA